MSKIFLDANIILDLIDLDRQSVDKTKKAIANLIKNGDELLTSCDIFTTVYYVASKRMEKQCIIEELEKLLTFLTIIPIDIKIISQAIGLSKQKKGGDLEDILQFVCASNSACEVILTNDKKFFTNGIKIFSVERLLESIA